MKIKCPFCGISATGYHRLASHWRGCSKNPYSMEDLSNSQMMKKLINECCNGNTKEIEAAIKEFAIRESEPAEDNNVEDNPSLNTTSFDLKDYFAAMPICREERQYACWLTSCLQNSESDVRKTVCEKFKKPYKIIQMHFEVSIMRDFWNACSLESRGEFNKKLLRFTKSEVPVENQYKHPNFWDSPPLMRWMMNAKPDIALLVEENGELRLYFIECKYQSGEDKYIDRTTSPNYLCSQCDVQKSILDFLCSDEEDFGLGIKFEGRKILSSDDIIKVRFVSGDMKPQHGWVGIPINKMKDELGI